MTLHSICIMGKKISANHLIWLHITLFQIMVFVFCPTVSSSDNQKIMLNFNTNDYHISDTDKKKIYNMLKNIKLGQKIKLTICGHADATGTRQHNYALSKKRATSVKNKIVSLFSINPRIIEIIAKGSDNPVDNNKTLAGRAKNRRVEVKLEIISKKRDTKAEPSEINKEKIKQLIAEAKRLVKTEKFNEAVKHIWEAKTLGGKRFSEWHSVYGIIGFYGSVKPADLIPIFKTALQLDPYNAEARDFLGRVKARVNVFSGIITSQVGLSIDCPIKVETFSQEYEYLKLFEVEPVKNFSMKNKPVDIWNCLTKGNKRITYYFDRSEVLRWAYIQ